MYLRRRALALGVAAAAVVFLVWGVVALTGSGGEPPAAGRPRPPLAVTAPPTEPPPSSELPPAAELPQCGDEVTRVIAEPVRQEVPVGEPVVLRLVVSNTGDHECVRDTNGLLRELVVSDHTGKRLWSSRDCRSESTNEQPLLRPGQITYNEVRWSGHTSRPGCPVERRQVTAGDYTVVAKLGDLSSVPAPFRLVRRP